jgi:hypothetical protein
MLTNNSIFNKGREGKEIFYILISIYFMKKYLIFFHIDASTPDVSDTDPVTFPPLSLLLVAVFAQCDNETINLLVSQGLPTRILFFLLSKRETSQNDSAAKSPLVRYRPMF